MKALIAEFLGTFAIVFFGCGTIASLAGDPGAHLMVNLVFGLTVGCCIYTLGHLSGAHFNPAVTLGFASVRRLAWDRVPGYLAAQVLGAVSASVLHQSILPANAAKVRFGATVPAVSAGPALLTELVLTFFLMLVIVGVATDERASSAFAGLAIGMFVTLAGLFGGPISGCSMNPARSLGPALFGGSPALGSLWIFVVAPIAGAIFAARLYEHLREPKPGLAGA